MPFVAPVWIAEGILKVSFFRMWFSMAGVIIMISNAATRPSPSAARHEHLADHRDQGDRQLHADLLLLVRRELVDDPVHGPRRARGVQGAEHQVPGLRGGDRRGDRLEVAHLAEEDHVRVLAQRAAHRLGEAGHVACRPRAG